MVRNKADYSVIIGKWRPTEAQPEPPLAMVLRTPFWSDDQYAGVRSRLRRPQVDTKVQFAGSFITINTRTKQYSVRGEEELQPCTPDSPVWLSTLQAAPPCPTESLLRERVDRK